MKPVLTIVLILASCTLVSDANSEDTSKIQGIVKDSIIYETLKQELVESDETSLESMEYLKTAQELADNRLFAEAADFILSGLERDTSAADSSDDSEYGTIDVSGSESIWDIDLSAGYYYYRYDTGFSTLDSSDTISFGEGTYEDVSGSAEIRYRYQGGLNSVIREFSPGITLSDEYIGAGLDWRLSMLNDLLDINAGASVEKQIEKRYRDSLDNAVLGLDISLNSPVFLKNSRFYLELKEDVTRYRDNTPSYHSLSLTRGRAGVVFETLGADESIDLYFKTGYYNYYGDTTHSDSLYQSYTFNYDNIGIGSGLSLMYLKEDLIMSLHGSVFKKYSISVNDPETRCQNELNLYLSLNRSLFSASMSGYVLFEKEDKRSVDREVIDSVDTLLSDTFYTYDSAAVSYSLEGWNFHLDPAIGMDFSENLLVRLHCKAGYFHYPVVKKAGGYRL
ncbi:MAG: hypothetical protein ACOCSE_03970, partial [Chitinivibrionales bacterium]